SVRRDRAASERRKKCEKRNGSKLHEPDPVIRAASPLRVSCGSLRRSCSLQDLARPLAGVLLEHAREAAQIAEARRERGFGDRAVSAAKELRRLRHANAQQVLVGRQAGLVAEEPAEMEAA